MRAGELGLPPLAFVGVGNGSVWLGRRPGWKKKTAFFNGVHCSVPSLIGTASHLVLHFLDVFSRLESVLRKFKSTRPFVGSGLVTTPEAPTAPETPVLDVSVYPR